MKKSLIGLLFGINMVFADGMPHLFIEHLNGIGTPYVSARENSEALKRLLPKNLTNSNMVTVDFIFNPTGDDMHKTFFMNLLDVMHQKRGEGLTGMTLDDLTDYWIVANNLPKYPKDSAEYKNLRAQISDNYATMIKEAAGDNFESITEDFHKKIPLQFADVIHHLETPYTQNPRYAHDWVSYDSQSPKKYYSPEQDQKEIDDLDNALDNYAKLHPDLRSMQEDYGKTKNMVLIVAHSQGNLYANSLFRYLTETEHFPKNQIAIYGVGSPAMENMGDWIAKALDNDASVKSTWGEISAYTTSSNDFVMNSVRNALPGGTMPSNIDIPLSTDDLMGHSFTKIYLNNEKSRTQIVKMVTLEATELIKEMAKNMHHFDLAMSSYLYPNRYKADPTIREGADNIVCDGTTASCSNDVLTFPTLRADYSINRDDLYFPQQTFGNRNYTFLKPRATWSDPEFGSLSPKVTVPSAVIYTTYGVSCINSNASCNNSPCTPSNQINKSGTTFATGYAAGYVQQDLVCSSYLYPQYFERLKIIAAKFSLP